MKAATTGDCIYTMDDLISIHAAREGGDSKLSIMSSGIKSFQSTPPVKAATYEGFDRNMSDVISIHAAREGGD